MFSKTAYDPFYRGVGRDGVVGDWSPLLNPPFVANSINFFCMYKTLGKSSLQKEPF